VKINISKQFYLYGLLSAFCYLCLAGCHSGPQPMPLDQLNAQQAHGHVIFQTNCARCHDDRDDSSLHAPALLAVFKRQYLPSGSPATDEHVTEIINQGYSLMPAIPNMDPQDTNDLLAYLHTL
jgi:mono/diheme cytochrome c family protein